MLLWCLCRAGPLRSPPCWPPFLLSNNTLVVHAVVQPHILNFVNMEGIKMLSHTFVILVYRFCTIMVMPIFPVLPASSYLVSKSVYLVIPWSWTQTWITATCVRTHASCTWRFLCCVRHYEQPNPKEDTATPVWQEIISAKSLSTPGLDDGIGSTRILPCLQQKSVTWGRRGGQTDYSSVTSDELLASALSKQHTWKPAL